MVFVLHFPDFGGPHNQALRLAPALVKHGVTSVTVLPPGPAAERLLEAGISVQTIPLGRVRAVPNILTQAAMLVRVPVDLFRLMRLFRRANADVIQLNGLMNPHAAITARVLGIPIVWQLVDTRPPMPVRRALMPLVRALADVVMPVGQEVARLHPGTTSFGDRMAIFYPPVDTDLFRPGSKSSLRVELGIPDDVPLVGVVGNVNPQKGHEHFIEAAIRIRSQMPEAKFVITGALHDTHTTYLAKLMSQAQRGGLRTGRDLFFLGSRSDVPNVMAAMDVFCLASVPNSEGTPTVILEAMASGLPVVATNVGSVGEVIHEGVTGFIVPSKDPAALADRVLVLLRNSEIRLRMGVRGRERAVSEFSIDKCVEAHLRAYRLAIQHGPIRQQKAITND